MVKRTWAESGSHSKKSSHAPTEEYFFFQQKSDPNYSDEFQSLQKRFTRIPVNKLPKVVRNSYSSLVRGLGPGSNSDSTSAVPSRFEGSISSAKERVVINETATLSVPKLVMGSGSASSPQTERGIMKSPTSYLDTTPHLPTTKLYEGEGDALRALYHQFKRSSKVCLTTLNELLLSRCTSPAFSRQSALSCPSHPHKHPNIPTFLEHRLSVSWKELLEEATLLAEEQIYREWQTTAAWKESTSNTKPILRSNQTKGNENFSAGNRSSAMTNSDNDSSSVLKRTGFVNKDFVKQGGSAPTNKMTKAPVVQGNQLSVPIMADSDPAGGSSGRDKLQSNVKTTTTTNGPPVTNQKLRTHSSRSTGSTSTSAKGQATQRLSTLGEELLDDALTSERDKTTGQAGGMADVPRGFPMATLQFVLSSKDSANKGWLTPGGRQPIEPFLEWLRIRLRFSLKQREENQRQESALGLIISPMVLLQGDRMPPKSANLWKQRQYLTATPSLSVLISPSLEEKTSLQQLGGVGPADLGGDSEEIVDLSLGKPLLPFPRFPIQFPWEVMISEKKKSSKANKNKRIIFKKSTFEDSLNIWQCRAHDGTTCIFYPNGQLAILASYGIVEDPNTLETRRLERPYVIVFPLQTERDSNPPINFPPTNNKKLPECTLPMPQAVFTCQGLGVLYHDDCSIPQVVLSEKACYLHAKSSGKLLKRQYWKSGKLQSSVHVVVNEYITFHCESRAEINLTYAHGSCKIHFQIGGENFTTENTDNFLKSNIQFTSQTAKDIGKAGKKRKAQKKVVKPIDKHKLHMQELQQTMDLDNDKYETREEKFLAKTKTKIAHLCESWLEHYRIHLGIALNNIRQMTTVGKPLVDSKRQIKSAYHQSCIVDVSKIRPITAVATSPKPLNSSREASSHLTRFNDEVVVSEINENQAQTSARQAPPTAGSVDFSHKSHACPVYARAKMLGLIESDWANLSCRCSRLHVPFITDLEFDYFLQKVVPSHQLICIAVVKSYENPNTTTTSAKHKAHLPPRRSSADSGLYGLHHAGGDNDDDQSQSYGSGSADMEHNSRTHQLLLKTSSYGVKNPMAQFVQNEYVSINRARPQHPCLLCTHDNYRFLFYDLTDAARYTGCTQSLLLRRHGAVPGICLVYKAGQLLFADRVFNGYGVGRRDFLQQMQRIREMSLKGFSLPSDYRLSIDRQSQFSHSSRSLRKDSKLWFQSESIMVDPIIQQSTDKSFKTSVFYTRGNLNGKSVAKEETFHLPEITTAN